MKEITKAILAVSKEVTAIEKSMSVGTGGSSYKAVSDSVVRNTLRPQMVKQGLVIVPVGVDAKTQVDRWEESDQYKGGMKSKQSIFTEANTKYLLIHQESGESIELAGYGHGVDSQDKGAGKATTYALKNTLLDLFLITKGEDFDTDATQSNDIDVPKSKAPVKGLSSYQMAIESLRTCMSKESREEMLAKMLKSTKLTATEKVQLQDVKDELDGNDILLVPMQD